MADERWIKFVQIIKQNIINIYDRPYYPTSVLCHIILFLYPCDLKCFLNLVAFVSTTSFQSLELLGGFGKKSSTYDHPSPVGVRWFLSLQGRLQEQIIFLSHRYMELKNEIPWVILKLKHPALARLQEQLWRVLRSREGAWGHARVHHWTQSEGA